MWCVKDIEYSGNIAKVYLIDYETNETSYIYGANKIFKFQDGTTADVNKIFGYCFNTAFKPVSKMLFILSEIVHDVKTPNCGYIHSNNFTAFRWDKYGLFYRVGTSLNSKIVSLLDLISWYSNKYPNDNIENLKHGEFYMNFSGLYIDVFFEKDFELTLTKLIALNKVQDVGV